MEAWSEKELDAQPDQTSPDDAWPPSPTLLTADLGRKAGRFSGWGLGFFLGLASYLLTTIWASRVLFLPRGIDFASSGFDDEGWCLLFVAFCSLMFPLVSIWSAADIIKNRKSLSGILGIVLAIGLPFFGYGLWVLFGMIKHIQ